MFVQLLARPGLSPSSMLPVAHAVNLQRAQRLVFASRPFLALAQAKRLNTQKVAGLGMVGHGNDWIYSWDVVPNRHQAGL